MGIDIKINIELSPKHKKIVRTAVVAGAVIGALGIGIAIAAPPTVFNDNDKLSAKTMNDNFAGLDSRLTKPVVTKNNKQYSLGAAYCGSTPATTGKITSGYAGAKSQCEGQCNSPSAHMCTNEDLVRSAQVGLMFQGWYSTGTFAGTGSTNVVDCYGWTNGGGVQGAVWGTGPDTTVCSTPEPILCCD